MSFPQFLNAIRARRKLLLYTLLVTMVTVVGLSLALPASYKATATLVLSYKGVDPLNGVVLPAQLMPGYMATQAGVIASKSVAKKVVEELKITESDAARQAYASAAPVNIGIHDWFADQLLKKVSVDASRDSSVVSIHVKADDPQFAAAIANAFAEKYQQTTVELRAEPMKKLSSYLSDQVAKLRAQLQEAHNKRAAFMEEKGLINIDERFDVETARLKELGTQLIAAQAQLAEVSSRSRQALEGRDQAPEVIADPLIQNLKAAVVRGEAELAKVATRFTPEHASYQAAQAEVAKARAALREQTRSKLASVGAGAHIAQLREKELQSRLDAQREKVLALNRARAELALFDKEVDTIHRTYDTSANRLQQASAEANGGYADVAMLTAAVPPARSSGPNVVLNALLSIALGTVLGIGLCLVAELLDRRVRSVDDLELVKLPVLGTIRSTALLQGTPPLIAQPRSLA